MTDKQQITPDIIKRMLFRWGWRTQPEDVATVAARVYSLYNKRAGHIVSLLNLADEETVEQLMQSKPRNRRTLDWLGDHISGIRRYAPMILAMQQGYPFFDATPSDTTPHPIFRDEAEVRERCSDLNAALLQIEGRQPLLIFSSMNDLLDFRQQGRQDRLRDPIYQYLGAGRRVGLTLGLARQPVIIAAQRQVRVDGDGEAAITAVSQRDVWYGNNSETPALRKMAQVMNEAIETNATDIDISPQSQGRVNLAMRRNTILTPAQSIPFLTLEEGMEIQRFLLSRSGALVSGTQLREAADGQFLYRAPSGSAFIRASFIPEDHGKSSDSDAASISLRLLPHESTRVDMKKLALQPEVLEASRRAIQVPKGMVMLVGPTNSGKSTTIAGLLGMHVDIFGNRLKRLSVEDPVEREIPGVKQFSVPNHLENGFEQYLIAMLRHDPDVIWVGETRTRETAETTVRAASTGHLVMTTLHADDTVMGWKMLANLITPTKQFDLIQSLTLIISQRLVKHVCPNCSSVEPPGEEQREQFSFYCESNNIDGFSLPAQIRKANSNGCDKCGESGFVGVLPINELLPFTHEVKRMLMDSDKLLYDEIASGRTMTLFESAYRRLAAGEIELEDVYQ